MSDEAIEWSVPGWQERRARVKMQRLLPATTAAESAIACMAVAKRQLDAFAVRCLPHVTKIMWNKAGGRGKEDVEELIQEVFEKCTRMHRRRSFVTALTTYLYERSRVAVMFADLVQVARETATIAAVDEVEDRDESDTSLPSPDWDHRRVLSCVEVCLRNNWLMLLGIPSQTTDREGMCAMDTLRLMPGSEQPSTAPLEHQLKDICASVFIDYLRRRQRLQSIEAHKGRRQRDEGEDEGEVEVEDTGALPDEQVAENESAWAFAKAMEACFATLTEGQRIAIIDHDYLGYSYSEVAKRRNLGPNQPKNFNKAGFEAWARRTAIVWAVMDLWEQRAAVGLAQIAASLPELPRDLLGAVMDCLHEKRRLLALSFPSWVAAMPHDLRDWSAYVPPYDGCIFLDHLRGSLPGERNRPPPLPAFRKEIKRALNAGALGLAPGDLTLNPGVMPDTAVPAPRHVPSKDGLRGARIGAVR